MSRWYEENRHRYPEDWPEISQRTRERAGYRCEQCGAQNRAWVIREADGTPYHLTDDQIDYCRVMGLYMVRIVLTVAHLDAVLPDGAVVSRHDKSHRHEEALAALCQRCHLNYDREDHIRNAAETRRRKQLERGQVEMELA